MRVSESVKLCYLKDLALAQKRLDRINPDTVVSPYPRGIGFAFHRAGGAGRIDTIL
jgi:hypothetical protein